MAHISDSHESNDALVMFNVHTIKAKGALPLVDVGDLALWNIEDIPTFFPRPPTILHILIKVRKLLIQFANI